MLHALVLAETLRTGPFQARRCEVVAEAALELLPQVADEFLAWFHQK